MKWCWPDTIMCTVVMKRCTLVSKEWIVRKSNSKESGFHLGKGEFPPWPHSPAWSGIAPIAYIVGESDMNPLYVHRTQQYPTKSGSEAEQQEQSCQPEDKE